MSEILIEQAFVNHWQNIPLSMPTAYENDGFNPTPGDQYATIRLFPNETLPDDLDTNAMTTGFFQFELRFPSGTGAIPAKLIRQQIFDAFPIETFVYGGIRIDITAKLPFTAETYDGWYLVVGRINYAATFNR